MFNDDYFQRTLHSIRSALVLACALYAVFGILDLFLAPSSLFSLWIIRYAVVCPFIGAAFAVSYLPIFKKINQLVISCVVLTAGFGILAMINLSIDLETRLYYYAGLMLVIAWSFTLVRLRFRYAVASCWTLVIAYSVSELTWQHALSTPVLRNSFINNNFFFIAANIIGMVANYYIEAYTRKDFLQRLLIADKQEKLQKERNELRDRNEIMTQELGMTRIIQEQLIPRESPHRGVHALYRPMEEVGGDFYDFIKFREPSRIGLFISDVSGHGVPSALITSMIKIIILESSRLKEDPAKLMIHLNDLLIDNTAENFITAFYGIYDYKTRKIVYANAGHYLPLVVAGGKIRTLKHEGSLPLAVYRTSEQSRLYRLYRNQTDTLPPRSKLFLFTDGLIEAKNAVSPAAMFSSRLNQVLKKNRNKPSDEFIQSVFAELVRFRGGERFRDDICMICLDSSPDSQND